MLRKKEQSGFSLIELMIVVAIIAIIGSIAYPSYTNYVWRAKRSEARSSLMDAAARLERFYSDSNVYATAANTFPAAANISTTSENDNYSLSLTTASPYQAYTISAQLQGATDAECGDLTLESNGTRGETGSGSVDDCWGR